MRPGIARLGKHLLWLDDLVDLGLGRSALGVYDVDARRSHTGNDQKAALEKRVAVQRRKGRRAGVPAKMVKLVALVRHDHAMDDLAVVPRLRVYVNYC